MEATDKPVTPQQVMIVVSCIVIIVGLGCLGGSFSYGVQPGAALVLRLICAILLGLGITAISLAIRSQYRRSRKESDDAAWATGAFTVPLSQRTATLAAISSAIGRSFLLAPEPLPGELRTAGQLSQWIFTRVQGDSKLCGVPDAARRVKEALVLLDPRAASAGFHTELRTLIPRGRVIRGWIHLQTTLKSTLPELDVSNVLLRIISFVGIIVVIGLMVVIAQYLDQAAPINKPAGIEGVGFTIVGKMIGYGVFFALFLVFMWVVGRLMARWLATFPPTCNTIYDLAVCTARPEDSGWTPALVWAQVQVALAGVYKTSPNQIAATFPLV